MELCNRNHDEVCYEGVSCPLCELIDEKAELEKEIEDLRKEIEQLEIQLEEN